MIVYSGVVGLIFCFVFHCLFRLDLSSFMPTFVPRVDYRSTPESGKAALLAALAARALADTDAAVRLLYTAARPLPIGAGLKAQP